MAQSGKHPAISAYGRGQRAARRCQVEVPYVWLRGVSRPNAIGVVVVMIMMVVAAVMMMVMVMMMEA